MADVFDEPRWFRDRFVHLFHVWPRFYWGQSLDAQLLLFNGSLSYCVKGFYGISVGALFVGYVRLRYQHIGSDA